jgi:hypothetical protein
LEDRARLIFPILGGGVVVFAASAAATYVNIGPRAHFMRVTKRIVALIERH